MCALAGVLLIIILISSWSRSGAECPNGWKHYQVENSCLTVYRHSTTWDYSRAKCKEWNGDLAVIMDFDKINFIRSKVKKREVWIGLHDKDVDGTYMLVNGSVYKSEYPGVGQYVSTDWTREKRCLAINLNNNMFTYTPCSSLRYGLCEIVKNRKVHTDSTTCSLDSCTCKRETWKFYEPGLKYIKPNHLLATHANSVKICEKLGGQLLTVLDHGTHSFVKDISSSWSPTGAPYWTGLQLSSVKGWKWTIDLKAYPLRFGHWFSENWNNWECAVVVWNYAGYLRHWRCSYKNYQVCETRDPCNARPILTIDGVQVKPEGNIYVTKSNLSQSVGIKCSAKGYVPSVNMTTFICFGMSERETGTLQVEASIVVNDTWHGKRCTCRVILNDGRNKQESFRINYLIPPRLKDNAKTIYEAPVGAAFYADIELIANPMPKTVRVLRTVSGTTVKELKHKIESGEKTAHHRLILSIDIFLESHTGNYTVTVDNGIQESLSSYIFLRVMEEENQDDESDDNLTLTLRILLIISWISIMIYLFSGKDEINEHDQGSETVTDSVRGKEGIDEHNQGSESATDSMWELLHLSVDSMQQEKSTVVYTNDDATSEDSDNYETPL